MRLLQHIEKVFKHKELEQQLVDAKLAQASLQITEAKEQSLQEKQMVSPGALIMNIHSHDFMNIKKDLEIEN